MDIQMLIDFLRHTEWSDLSRRQKVIALVPICAFTGSIFYFGTTPTEPEVPPVIDQQETAQPDDRRGERMEIAGLSADPANIRNPFTPAHETRNQSARGGEGNIPAADPPPNGDGATLYAPAPSKDRPRGAAPVQKSTSAQTKSDIPLLLGVMEGSSTVCLFRWHGKDLPIAVGEENDGLYLRDVHDGTAVVEVSGVCREIHIHG